MASTSLSGLLLSLLPAGVLLAAADTSVAARTEFPHAAGTDLSGRAQAVSDAAGRVLIESPEFPRGLWVDLADEGGRAVAGIQVEYQGRSDSLVALRCVDPSGQLQEALLWTRPVGDPLSLSLKSGEPAHLPAELTSIDWQVDPSLEALMIESGRLVGWTAVEALLRERWQGQVGQVVVKLDDGAALVDLDRSEAMERLMAHLERTHQPVTSSLADPPHFGVLVDQSGHPFLRKATVLYSALFEDAALESYVRDLLDRRHGRITREVASLKSLDYWSSGLQSLAGLEHATGLGRLRLRDHEIVDVGPLASLTSLDRLDLQGNQIVDVGPLAALTGLGVLELSGNHVVHVGPLASLTNMEWMSLGGNQIVDVSPLAALTGLESLGLSGNQIVDATPLAALTRLRQLTLGGNQIVDVSFLATLTNLEWLHLDSAHVGDASPLTTLSNLRVLRLNSSQITDVSPLATLTNLERLWLEFNQITDVSPLASLTRLRYLHLDDNQVEDISPLIANPGLGKGDSVHLRDNPPH